MLRKIGIMIIVIVLFQSFMIKDDSFTKYYQLLKIIDLPLIIDCEESIQYPDYSNIPEKLDEKFRREGHKTLGRIDLNKNIISIIQVVQAENEFPVIYNYKVMEHLSTRLIYYRDHALHALNFVIIQLVLLTRIKI